MTLLAAGSTAAAAPVQTVEIAAETAGIDGRAWDATFPDVSVVDAVHRSVLVRFPAIGDALTAPLQRGLGVVKAELVLDYDGYETAPSGYVVRTTLGEHKWKRDPPRWHIVARLLRRPWFASDQYGPTFNASVNARVYWTKYGAADPRNDHFPRSFGPTELSHAQRTARIDVTDVLSSSTFAREFSDRIRALRDFGFLLRKLEDYDQRYRDAGDAYEWAVAVGGHGLKFRNVRLTLTLGTDRTEASRLALPPALDTAVVRSMPATGAASARIPDAAAFATIAHKLANSADGARPGWQQERLDELLRIGGGRAAEWARMVATVDYRAYQRLLRDVLARPPRYWEGWDIGEDLLIWHLYRDLLPAPVQDHLKRYWASWLMPDLETAKLAHPQSSEATEYVRRTGDWRGKASFFRGGYNYSVSTQNFNHTAAMGALLGGALIGADRAVADGRHGLEHYPLRLWSVRDGSVQEMLDHYYLSISLSAQKMFADFGPAPADRLMGRVMVDRTLELLASAFHPQLRRIVSPSGRARLSGVLVEQDGIYAVLHSLSRRSALIHPEPPLSARTQGLPVFGGDVPPGRVALQAHRQPWAENWLSNVIDDKRLPFEEIATDTIRGAFDPPLWRRTYLGRHYALSSQDLRGGTVDVLAQWNHKPTVARAMEDLGTLTARYVVNEPQMTATSAGEVQHAGILATFQHKNRAVICAKPHTDKDQLTRLAGAGLRSLGMAVALWNFRNASGWQLYVDGLPVSTFPTYVKAGQVVTLKDGVSFVGLIPLPATDLGRSAEVLIDHGVPGKAEPYGAPVAPAFTVVSYNLHRDRSVDPATLDWPRMATRTIAGFVVELGDEVEHGSFDAFQAHMRRNVVQARWDERARILHVSYRTGADVLEVGCGTEYTQLTAHYPVPPGHHLKALAYRRVNGRWPYLAPGIDRETPLMQSGTTGRLEKNGAVLITARGRKAILQHEPVSNTFVAYNPLPDPVDWALSLPPGVSIEADGRVGLLRLVYQANAKVLSIEYAPEEEQHGVPRARHLMVTGMTSPPRIVLNGEPVIAPLKLVPWRGKSAFAVPLPRSP